MGEAESPGGRRSRSTFGCGADSQERETGPGMADGPAQRSQSAREEKERLGREKGKKGRGSEVGVHRNKNSRGLEKCSRYQTFADIFSLDLYM